MKKLFLFFSIVLLSVVTFAQSTTFTPLEVAKTKFVSTTAYNLTNTTARTFILAAPKHQATTQDFYIKLDTLGTGAHTNVAVALSGAKFADGAYSAIGSTVNWKCTTGDTIIVISNATANRYSYYKWTVTGTGTAISRVIGQQLKLYLE